MPKDDLSPRDDGPIQPAQVIAAGPHGGTQAGQAIIAANAQVINAFVHAQRQNVHRSTLTQHKATFTSANLDIIYRHHFGHEHIQLLPYPVPTPPFPDEPIPPPPDIPIPDIPQPSIYSPELVDKYLLVLYATDKFAAFKMSSLAPGQATIYGKGTAKDSNFGSNPILVAQYKFAGTGVILTPADLTGGKNADPAFLQFCTTVLVDQVPTSAPYKCLPVMNASTDGKTVYTCGGAFQQTNGKLTLTSAIGDTTPYAIDTAGNCYIQPFFTSFALGVEWTQTAYFPKSAFIGAVSTAEQAAIVYRPIEAGFYVTESKQVYTKSTTGIPDTDNPIFSYKTDTTTNDLSNATTVYSIAGADQQVNQVEGLSYYGKGSYGQAYQPASLTIATGPTFPVQSFDLSSNHTKPIGDDVPPQPSFDINMPGPIYDTAKGVDTLGIDPFKVKGVATLTYTPDPTAPVTYTSLPGVSFGASISDEYGNFDSNNRTDVQVAGVGDGGILAAIAPSYPATQTIAAADAYTAAAKSYLGGLASGSMNYAGTPIHYVMTLEHDEHLGILITHTDVTGGDGLVAPKIDGQYYSASWTNETNGVPDGPYEYNTWLYDYHPYQINTVYTPFVSTHVEVFAESYTNLAAPSINYRVYYHPFPPAVKKGMDAKYWYTLVTEDDTLGTLTYKIRTPYADFNLADNFSSGDSFRPWCHISNGKHYIQGFYTGGTGFPEPRKHYLYLDGKDVMPALTKALDCLDTDIKALFMDITLQTIKGLKKITAKA